jgi:NADPH-dependent 7-cyano-7-deazaguanine reductase QueF-like protein
LQVKSTAMTSTAHHADPSHASPLGKATEYQSHYAPELLYPIPRQLKRSEIGIADAACLSSATTCGMPTNCRG